MSTGCYIYSMSILGLVLFYFSFIPFIICSLFYFHLSFSFLFFFKMILNHPALSPATKCHSDHHMDISTTLVRFPVSVPSHPKQRPMCTLFLRGSSFWFVSPGLAGSETRMRRICLHKQKWKGRD